MSNSFKGYPTATPWRITGPDERKWREIVGADGSTVAKLTALDLPNAELIVASVNRPAREAAERQSIEDDAEFQDLLGKYGDTVTKGYVFTEADEEAFIAARRALIAHIDTWGARRDSEAIPDVLSDGKAVYDEIVRKVGKAYCGNPSVVADTLDAVVRIIRRGAAPAPGNTEKPKEDP